MLSLDTLSLQMGSLLNFEHTLGDARLKSLLINRGHKDRGETLVYENII